MARERDPEIDWGKRTELPEGVSEEDALRATAALHAAVRLAENEMEKPDISGFRQFGVPLKL